MKKYNYNLKDLFSLIIGILAICIIMFLDTQINEKLKYPLLYGYFIGALNILFIIYLIEYLDERGII